MTQVQWIASSEASALYIAAVLAQGQVAVDARIATAMDVPARRLVDVARGAGLPERELWRHVVPLAALVENEQDLADRVLREATGRSPAAENVLALADAVREVQYAFQRAVPDATAELTLRLGPFREQWEARGPGLLAAIGRFTERSLVVDLANILGVSPVCGGGGESYSSHGAVAIEAVLANPHRELPEVARLGWLIARLSCGRVEERTLVAPERRPRLTALALVPAVLAAAEYVELTRFDVKTISFALAAWRMTRATEADGVAILLDRWWRGYCDERGEWLAALAMLAPLVGEKGL